MSWAETISLAFSALGRHKLRSLLTMLGMIIGVGGVIGVISIGESAKGFVTNTVESYGVNFGFVNRRYFRNRSCKSLHLRDCELIRQQEGVTNVTPYFTMGRKVTYDKVSKSALLFGTAPCSQKMFSLNLISGRYLNERDCDRKSRVAVLSEALALELFGTNNAIGKRFRVGDDRFTVIGLCRLTESQQLVLGTKYSLYCPATWLSHSMGLYGKISRIIFTYGKDCDIEKLQAKLPAVLSAAHKYRGEYRVSVLSDLVAKIGQVSAILTLAVAAIAAISLLVGGIGIMNIMLVSVAERTSEIGLRKAIGARNNDILKQFLAESAAVSLVGGILGTICGALLTQAGLSIISWKVEIAIPLCLSPLAISVALITSTSVGLFFGIWPAYKASRLSPIGALRHL